MDRLRTRSLVRMLRAEPVLVVPPDVTPAQVAGCAALWCPEVDRLTDSVLALADAFELYGPVEYDPAVWRRVQLPPEFPQAYAVRFGADGNLSPISDWARFGLVTGLARRLSGSCRSMASNPWDQPHGEPADPCVLAPRKLPAEEALRLLQPSLPELHIRDQDEAIFTLAAGAVSVWGEVEKPAIFPLVRMQPWFASASALTECEFVSDGSASGRGQAETAARALTAATGGILLDDDGFPWPS